MMRRKSTGKENTRIEARTAGKKSGESKSVENRSARAKTEGNRNGESKSEENVVSSSGLR